MADEPVREEVKSKVRRLLIDCARRRSVMTYLELAREIGDNPFFSSESDSKLATMLCRISEEEYDSNSKQAILCAVVVREDTLLPGITFFTFARELNKDLPSDNDKCWSEVIRAVWKYYHR